MSARYAFSDARALGGAVEWLADNQLVDDAALTRFLEEPPEPDVA